MQTDQKFFDAALAGLERLARNHGPRLRPEAHTHMKALACRLAREWPSPPDAPTIARLMAFGAGVDSFLRDGVDRPTLQNALAMFDAAMCDLNIALRNAASAGTHSSTH